MNECQIGLRGQLLITLLQIDLDSMRGSTSTRQHLHIGDETLLMKLLERGVLTLN